MQLILRSTLSEDIDIAVISDSGMGKAVADAAQLESAILNLALNARDAMPNGGKITVNVSDVSLDGHYQGAHPDVRPGDYVMIAVTDDGEGMTPP